MHDIKLSLLLPTRQRPHLVRRFLDSLVSTASNITTIEVVIYVDDDDTTRDELDLSGVTTKLIVGPPCTMGFYNTKCLEHSNGDIIILVNDDLVFKNTGWDEIIINLHSASVDKIYLFYPNDLYIGSKFSTFPIISKTTAQILIAPYPAGYKRAFIDLHLFDIFKRLEHIGYTRYFYLDKVVFEHLHFQNNKAVFDDVYAKRESVKFADDDKFINLSNLRQNCAVKLANAIESSSNIANSKNYYTAFDKIEDGDIIVVASNAGHEISTGFKYFINDNNLPLIWRIYLTKKFFLRALIQHIGYNYSWYKWFKFK